MPRGPKGEKRPADVIGNAVHVMRIATGEVEDQDSLKPATPLRRAKTKPSASGILRRPTKRPVQQSG